MKKVIFIGIFLIVAYQVYSQEKKKIQSQLTCGVVMDGDTLYTDEDFRKKLTPEQYEVLRKKGTERPFSGKYTYNKDSGTYVCAACGNKLFSSNTKYNSGSGWPSFYDVMSQNSVETKEDTSLGMVRIEILCKKCGSHLGHVFPDGPNPTGMRYCVNSLSLNFEPAPADSNAPSQKKGK